MMDSKFYDTTFTHAGHTYRVCVELDRVARDEYDAILWNRSGGPVRRGIREMTGSECEAMRASLPASLGL